MTAFYYLDRQKGASIPKIYFGGNKDRITKNQQVTKIELYFQSFADTQTCKSLEHHNV